MSKKLIVGLAVAGSLIAGTGLAADTATDTKAKPSASTKAKPSGDKAKSSEKSTKSTSEAATPAGGGAAATTDVETKIIASAPVPDTKENRAKFPPLSALGRSTTPRGN